MYRSLDCSAVIQNHSELILKLIVLVIDIHACVLILPTMYE